MIFNTCLDIPALMGASLSPQMVELGNTWLESLCAPSTPSCSADELHKAAVAIGQACENDIQRSPGGAPGLLLSMLQNYDMMKEALCSKSLKWV